MVEKALISKIYHVKEIASRVYFDNFLMVTSKEWFSFSIQIINFESHLFK